MSNLTVGDLLAIPEIASFTARRPVFRVSRSDNQVLIKDTWYELRLFAFYVPGSNIRFADFVKERGLADRHFTVYSQLKHVQPLAFSIVDDTVLLNISLLPVEFTLPLAN